ncbi:MAG: metal-dependent phosphoesterase [Candidatus Hecatellales archaeon]|nr:MAG: metal-dependent phosphoesterase [Candidatus Hecatellales archaeon]
MRIKIDLHVHTVYSRDSRITIDKAIKVAKKVGLDGFAITDHDTTEAHKKIPKNSGLIIIPGIEITTREGHLIGLGVSEPIKPGLSALETAEKIREAGGIVIVPHPMNPLKNSLGIDAIREINPDGVETFNASTPNILHVKKIEDLIEEMGYTKTGGSDAHIPSSIGKAYTIMDVRGENPEEVFRSIKRGKTIPVKEEETSLKEVLPKILLKIKTKILRL